jgi:hypothetical protein
MPTVGEFQTPFEAPSGFLDGSIEAEVYEDDPLKPTTVISTDQDWGITVTWSFTGGLVNMIGGKWNLQAHLETMGPGTDVSLPDPPLVIELDPPKTDYEKKIEVDAGTVAKGPYKLVITLLYKDLTDGPGPVAGYVEGPMLQFYEP